MASDLLNRRKGDFQAAAEPLQNITDPIKLKGAFRMLDYFISHCQLVYRDTVALGDETNPTPHNTDLYFVGADYLDLPFWFEDPTIRQGRDDEFAVLESRCHLNGSSTVNRGACI